MRGDVGILRLAERKTRIGLACVNFNGAGTVVER